MNAKSPTLLAQFLCLILALGAAGGPHDYFKIRVVDSRTGRGVPLVELETTAHQRFYTDSAGVAAFNEPGLMDHDVWFGVRSDGYEFPKDGFGNAGVRLKIRAGSSAEIKIQRVNIAERLYRITGAGIYRDTILLGEPAPIEQPVLNGDVVGQDTSVPTVYRGQIHWFWGDTGRPQYPLGNFHTAGAISGLPGLRGLPPSLGINLHYFTNKEGLSRGMAPLDAPGPVWIEQPIVLMNAGRETMLTYYARIKSLGEPWEQGLMNYDDASDKFLKLIELPLNESWRHPASHGFRWMENGTDYYGFTRPFVAVRVKADWPSATNPAAYEAFTCLASNNSAEYPVVQRDASGNVVWHWQKELEPLTQPAERDLIKRGLLKPAEARYQLTDSESGKPVEIHHASICWNHYRQRWILIAVQTGGRSVLGEVWYAEAPNLIGPWRNARRIVTHEKYSFYNPAQLPFFDEENGRYIYFEGTYCTTFSGNEHPTPLYDYNQMMYRLDLADPRLH